VTRDWSLTVGGAEDGYPYTLEMASLSVIIPATDHPSTLGQVADAVRRASAAPEELIVVDQDPELGPAAARNFGARRARGDVLVFVDADVEVHSDAFVQIRRAFESDGELTAVFGSYDDDPERHGLVSDFRNLLHHHVHQEGAGEATTFWAGLGAVRREAFVAVWGFDERRFPHPSIEDIDLGMRLAANGGRIRLDPTIQGKHLKRWTFFGMVRTDLLRRGAPWVRLLLAEQSPSKELNLGWRHRASAAASVALVAAVLARRPRIAGATTVAFVWLNRRFYLVLVRKRGWRQAAAGIPLHAVHQLVAVAAVPAGVVLYLWDRASGTSSPFASKSSSGMRPSRR